MKNLLLEEFTSPFGAFPFDQAKPDTFRSAIETAIDITREEIDAIASNPEAADFFNTLEALDKSGEKLGRLTSALFNLNSAETSKELQEVTQKVAPQLSALQNDIRLNEQLFKKIKTVYDAPPANLNSEQITLLEKEYKSFTRNGALLPQNKKQSLRQIDQELAQLGLLFGEHVLADTNAFSLQITDEKKIEGIPENVANIARERAKKANKEGWIFTLDYPSYIPVMTFACDRDLRKQMNEAFGRRSFQKNPNNNEETILKIVALRHQRATLLGYSSHAAFVLEERMAKDENTVRAFLDDLHEKAFEKAKEEWEELVSFGKNEYGYSSVEKWDTAFLAEKIKQQRFAFNEEELRPYFALPKVLDGLFVIVNKLYGLEFKHNPTIPVYHSDVQVFEVFKDKKFHALLYTDFYPRAGKRDGAWMTSYCPQKEGQRPHISIVCNFSPPTKDNPALLTFNEVTTLFHEFGHALHGMLANTTYSALSGTNVLWDFVELPSQVFENWCYQPEALELFAKHYKTNALIPQHYIDKIKQAGTFHQGLQTLRQLSFGYLDLSWHTEDSNTIKNVKAHEKEILTDFQFTRDVENNCMSTAFSHIFQGGYAAGYYSYKWAEVLDADAFEVFKEEGVFDAKTAKLFHDTVLSKGGTEHPMDLYIRFRGKKPSPNALLKRAGLIPN